MSATTYTGFETREGHSVEVLPGVVIQEMQPERDADGKAVKRRFIIAADPAYVLREALRHSKDRA